MKSFLFLFASLFISTVTLSQSHSIKVELMDAEKTEALDWDKFSYVVLGLEDEVVIESKQDVYLDFSSADLGKKSVDSIQVTLGTEATTEAQSFGSLQPMLLKRLDEDVNVKIQAFAQGDTLKFNSVDANAMKIEIKRYSRPMFVKDTIVFGILAIVLALIFYTSSKNTKFWKTFYMIVPALLLCYLIPAVLDMLGLISKDYSDLYTMAKNYMLPGALILMTLGIDFKGIWNLGPKALIMFGTATVGIIIGGPIAILIYAYIDPSVVGTIPPQFEGDPAVYDSAWRGFSTLAGSWIGGGANQAAMLETYSYNQSLYGKMVTVDIVVANLWMAFLLWAAARANKFDRWLKADSSSIEDLKKRVSDYQSSIAKKPTLTDYMVIAGITFGVVAIGHFAGKWMAGKFDPDSPFGSSFFWLVVITTTGGLILSATKLRRYEGAGASKIGSVFIYILVATIGMKMELTEAVKEPQLILVGIIWMLVHVGLLFLVGKIIKAPFFFIAVGSKANVGGAASAPIIASAFHPSLASVGAILAVLGYAVGTYGAIACAKMMEAVAPVVDVAVK
jgi:uncharacterized membrane protein